MSDKVVLVDAQDHPLGEMDKMEAHQKGCLHRAVSVIVFTTDHRMLLQKRAVDKYHSAGLWTNAACTHPFPGESNEAAAVRRLRQELGIRVDAVTPLFHFLYKEELDNGLMEHELDHVFVAYSNETPTPDPLEVSDWKWVRAEALTASVQRSPEAYTVWFKKMLDRVLDAVALSER
jgi:isopentenyl-diphosphate delta-isomerase